MERIAGGGRSALPRRPPPASFCMVLLIAISSTKFQLIFFFYEALPLCKYYLLLFNIYNNVTTAELLFTTVHYQVATTVSLFVLTTKYHCLLLLFSLQCRTPFCSSMTSSKTISTHLFGNMTSVNAVSMIFFVERNPPWLPKKQTKKGPSECKQITHE